MLLLKNKIFHYKLTKNNLLFDIVVLFHESNKLEIQIIMELIE